MSMRVFLRGPREQKNRIIYFKGARDIFGILLREQGIYVPVVWKGTLTKILQRNGI